MEAPGLDGFTTEFFQASSDIIRDDILNDCPEFISKSHTSSPHTKESRRPSVHDFRPIGFYALYCTKSYLSSWPISWNVSLLKVFKGINSPSLLDDKVVIMWFSVVSAWDMSFQGKNCRHERPLSLLYQRSMTVWNETFNEHRGLVWSGCLVWYLLRKSLDVYQVFVLLGIPLLFLIYFLLMIF